MGEVDSRKSHLLSRKFKCLRTVLVCRACPIDAPPVLPMRLSLKSRDVRTVRPLSSLPIARPMPSPSLLCERSEDIIKNTAKNE